MIKIELEITEDEKGGVLIQTSGEGLATPSEAYAADRLRAAIGKEAEAIGRDAGSAVVSCARERKLGDN